MKIIKFTEDFPKLDEDVFSTIRRKDYRIKCGIWHKIKSPTKEFKAMCINRVDVRIGELPDGVLLHDTNTSTRAEAMDLLRKFYPNLEDIHKVTLLWFARPGVEVGESGIGPITIGTAGL